MNNITHALLDHGAPHSESGLRIAAGVHKTDRAAGWGRAKCRCGAMSSVLTCRNSRSRWFDYQHAPSTQIGVMPR